MGASGEGDFETYHRLLGCYLQPGTTISSKLLIARRKFHQVVCPFRANRFEDCKKLVRKLFLDYTSQIAAKTVPSRSKGPPGGLIACSETATAFGTRLNIVLPIWIYNAYYVVYNVESLVKLWPVKLKVKNRTVLIQRWAFSEIAH